MYLEGENKKRKTAIELDWEKLLPRQDDEPPPLLVVTTIACAADQPQSTMWSGDGLNLRTIPDAKLDEFIARQRMTYETMASRTPDKGQKILAKLSSLEEEKERRKNRLGKDDGGGVRPRQSHNPNFNGASRGFRQGAPSPPPHSRFGLNICQKMEENTDCGTVNAFGKEYTATGRCDRRRRRSNEQFPARGKYNTGITLRQTTFQCASFFSVDIDKRNVSNGAIKGRNFSPGSPNVDEDLSITLSKRDASKVHPSNNLRPRNYMLIAFHQGKTVVLVDEEEPQFVETVQHEEEVDDCIKEIKICYPSRDDPESVEICYADMECLAPETYLSSTIMNFYIRYLQRPTSTTDRARCGYHFFTTYFYEKLKEAVLNKTSDEEKLFVKFRRWWKGVDIFEKAYIFLPIHEYQHWSLVIICIPDKEDESGPILLHLDSLGLHSSSSIFDNVRSFLKKEWIYLNQVEASSHYPLVDRIWHNLPRRIDESKVMVPQQKNVFDCGLFVLFFMKRFIEEAPHRLKKKDFAMFGKQWFNPKEASGLRLKIQSILVRKFKKESVDRSVLEP